MSAAHIILPALLLTCGFSARANAAAELEDRIVYVQTQSAGATGIHLPGGAKIEPRSLTRTITIAVTAQNPDGSALVHVNSHKEPPDNISSIQRSSWEKFASGEFQAQLSSEGALLIAQDDMLQPGDLASAQGLSLAEYAKRSQAQASDPGFQGKATASEIAVSFSIPNAVVLSMAKRKSNAAGDSWRVLSNPEGHPYDVTITGTQTVNGHEILLISATGKYEDPVRATVVDAKLSYDPVSHRILSFHSVSTSNMPSNGISTTYTTQLDLRQ